MKVLTDMYEINTYSITTIVATIVIKLKIIMFLDKV